MLQLTNQITFQGRNNSTPIEIPDKTITKIKVEISLKIEREVETEDKILIKADLLERISSQEIIDLKDQIDLKNQIDLKDQIDQTLKEEIIDHLNHRTENLRTEETIAM